MPSPPKPWEVNNTASAIPVVSQTATDTIPAVPDRPSTITNTNTFSSSYGGTTGGFGNTTTSYGGYGSSYSSPYNRLGYGSYGSSYGGYGSSYGGYGSSYGGYGSYGGMNSYGYNRFGGTGYNRFGNGMYGPEGPDEFTLSRRMESSTRATFDVIESIVGAFGGFAQMLDSTYMATHSSFMAMVGVAEQYGNIRHYLGNIFNVFALIRWIKRLLYRLVGKTPPPELAEPSPEQKDGQLQIAQDDSNQEAVSPPPATATRKRHILLFLALVTGLPYFVYKLIQRSNRFRQQQMQSRMMIPQYGGPPPEIARVMHDFVAEAPIELPLRQGETIEVLSKVDPATGAPCEWWQGRSANGVVGIFPANFVQIQN